MSSRIIGILTIALLIACHLRTRRHPCWSTSRDAQYFFSLAYPIVLIAVFWLAGAATTTGWEWAIGNFWALCAMVLFVYGFDALQRAREEQQHASQTIEAIHIGEDEPAPAPEQGSNGHSLA